MLLGAEELLQAGVVEEVPQTKAVVVVAGVYPQSFPVREVAEELGLLRVEGAGAGAVQALAVKVEAGDLGFLRHLRFPETDTRQRVSAYSNSGQSRELHTLLGFVYFRWNVLT